jgi:signal transduction histidine kinase
VGITEQERAVTVSVTNSGSEIAPEHQTKIFNKFYQADESHASEGNGIGLAIVKRVVELHEGSVSVSSGGGKTTFTVVLPK